MQLSGETSIGVQMLHLAIDRGVERTAVTARRLSTVEESAAAIVVAGIAKATKGQTQSREPAR